MSIRYPPISEEIPGAQAVTILVYENIFTETLLPCSAKTMTRLITGIAPTVKPCQESSYYKGC